MILKTLHLKNFRKFKEVNLEFPEGVIGVVGLNGVGKSTLFEAVAWVLYGPAAARTGADQIKRQQAETKDPCRVELDFSFEDNDYRIVREIRGKQLTPSATVLKNGSLVAQGAEPSTIFIQKTIGLDFKSFFTSIFAKQKELNMLSSLNASERRPLILKMLGITSLDEVIKEIRSDSSSTKQLREHLKQQLFDLDGTSKKQQLETKAKQQKKEIGNKQKQIENLDKQVQTTKEEVKQQSQEIKKQKQQYETILKQKDNLAEIKNKIEQREHLSIAQQKIQEKIKNKQNTIEKLEKTIQKIKPPEDEIKEVDIKLKTSKEIITTLTKSIEQHQTLNKRIQHELQELKEKKQHIKQLGPQASCPTCDRTLGEQHQHLLNHFSKELKEKKQQQHEHQQQIQQGQKKHELEQKKQDALEKRQRYLQGLAQQLKEHQHTKSYLLSDQKQLQKEIKEIQRQLTSFKNLKFDEKEFTKIKNKLRESYNSYQELLSTYEEIKEKLHQKTLEKEQILSGIQLLKQQQKQIQKDIKHQEQLEQKLKEQTIQHDTLRQLEEIMIQFRTFLISRIRPTLSMYASEFFLRLTDGKYQLIDLDEQYNISIVDNGESYAIKRFSGGEEDLANLCIRLAISEVITERAGGAFNFIILDEIFGSQDYIRRQNIMHALQTLSAKFRQVFIITHVEDIKNSLEYAITVHEQNNEQSTVKIE